MSTVDGRKKIRIDILQTSAGYDWLKFNLGLSREKS
jgi:hypothetical protein